MKQTLLLFCSFLFSFMLYSQEVTVTDTIELARNKAYAKQFSEADQLLKYYTSSKNDLNAFRLHAQILYWMKDFKQSASILQRALAAYPGETVLFLDYGRLLYNTGDIVQSEKYLIQYRQTDSLNTETNLMLAHIWYWQGRFKEAASLSENLLLANPNQQEALNLLNVINLARAVYIKINGTVFSDDQPLTSQQATVETGAYRSALFSPKLKLTSFNFQANQQTSFHFWLQAGNSFSSGKNRLSLSLTGGLFQAANISAVTGEAELTKKLGRYITANVMAAYKPYLLTVAAANKPIMQTAYSGSLQYNRKDQWFGKLFYELQQFADKNRVYTAYAWASAPIVHKEQFRLNAGYAFAWQTTEKNKATFKEPLPPLAAVYNNQQQVQTVYDPYFTPLNQFVHSLLLSTKIFFTKQMLLNLRGSVGVMAHADIPYFAVQFNPPQYVLYKDFTGYAFHPAEFFAAFELHPSKQFHLQINYQYNSVLFYKLHQGSVQLNYRFYHEKK